MMSFCFHTYQHEQAMKKFLIRNFPDEAHSELERLAIQNERSLEGEARLALLKWIHPP